MLAVDNQQNNFQIISKVDETWYNIKKKKNEDLYRFDVKVYTKG